MSYSMINTNCASNIHIKMLSVFTEETRYTHTKKNWPLVRVLLYNLHSCNVLKLKKKPWCYGKPKLRSFGAFTSLLHFNSIYVEGLLLAHFSFMRNFIIFITCYYFSKYRIVILIFWLPLLRPFPRVSQHALGFKTRPFQFPEITIHKHAHNYMIWIALRYLYLKVITPVLEVRTMLKPTTVKLWK
jgi:hypothetical protein